MTYRPFTLLLLACVAAPALDASITYQFTVNTQALTAQSGNLDFQLDPAMSPAPYVSLLISNLLIINGTFNPTSIMFAGDASGTLPSALLLDNAGGTYNDAFQAVTLGTSLRFLATFNGPGITTPSNNGTTFAFSIYDGTGTTAELTTSADGSIAGIDADNIHGVAPFTNPATASGISAATVTTTPEPSSWLLMFLGCSVGLFVLRRRSATLTNSLEA